jgi:pilus assembly protein Flp/PilA
LVEKRKLSPLKWQQHSWNEGFDESSDLAAEWRCRCLIVRNKGGSVSSAAYLVLFERRKRIMKTMKTLLIRLWREEEGQDLTEYALLLVLLVLAAVTTLGNLASAINGVFVNVTKNLNNGT